MEKPTQKLIDSSSPLFQEVIRLHQAGQLDAAQDAYQALHETYPQDHRIMSNLGTLYLQQGNLQKGIATIESSLALYSDQPHAHNSLGNVMASSGQYKEALLHFDRATALLPDLLEAQVNRASVLQQLERFDEALRCINAALARRSDRPEWHLLQATILSHLSLHEASLQSVNEALKLRPDFLEALSHKSFSLSLLGRESEALEILDLAVHLDPASADLQLRRGAVLKGLLRWGEALACFSKAIDLDPKNAQSYIGIGQVHFLSKAYQEAIEAFGQAIALNSSAFEPYAERANTFFVLHRHQEALEDFGFAIRLMPSRVQSYIDRAAVFQAMGAYRLALSDLWQTYNLAPSNERCLPLLLFNGLKSLEWGGLNGVLSVIQTKIDEGASVCGPFALLATIDDPALHLQSAELYLKALLVSSLKKVVTCMMEQSDKIRVGYFSSDYREHPVAINLLPVIKAHNRERFSVVAFDFSPRSQTDKSHEILEAFDAVYDVRDLSDAEAAALSRRLGIHIAVDLNGHTEHSRTGIFNEGAAPIQVNYLGYPGTMGGSFYDYIIADQLVIPVEYESHFSEQVVHLPSFFMPYSFHGSEIERQWTRSHFGIPEGSFVFCSFNDFYKISEEIFSAWVHLLRSTENSVLYLWIRGDITGFALREKIRLMGADSSRVIIAERTEHFKEHLSRLALCDLMLDTFPYNSHTTACDAIMAGLPLIAMRGQSFASRVSSSLLEHIGVPDLVANSVAEYRTKAIELAKNPDYYRAVRERVAAGRNNLPSDKVYTQNLEALFSDMVRGHE